jgi:hypothetical protein
LSRASFKASNKQLAKSGCNDQHKRNDLVPLKVLGADYAVTNNCHCKVNIDCPEGREAGVLLHHLSGQHVEEPPEEASNSKVAKLDPLVR